MTAIGAPRSARWPRHRRSEQARAGATRWRGHWRVSTGAATAGEASISRPSWRCHGSACAGNSEGSRRGSCWRHLQGVGPAQRRPARSEAIVDEQDAHEEGLRAWTGPGMGGSEPSGVGAAPQGRCTGGRWGGAVAPWSRKGGRGRASVRRRGGAAVSREVGDGADDHARFASGEGGDRQRPTAGRTATLAPRAGKAGWSGPRPP